MLSAWRQDPEFLDSAGNPRELAVDGAPPGFAEFVRRYGGDIPAGAVLKGSIPITAAEFFTRAPDRLVAAKGTLLNGAIVAEEAELED